MRTRRSSKRKGSSRIIVVTMVGVGSIAAAVAGAFVLPSLTSSHTGSRAAAATPTLCQNLEIDAAGQIRDRGMVPCSRIVGQGRRMHAVRDGFTTR